MWPPMRCLDFLWPYLLWGLPFSLSAQIDPVIHGRVEDASTGEPIQGVLILAADSTAGTLSDSLGVFAISLGPEGPFVLHAKQFGCKPTVFELPTDAAPQLSVLKLPSLAIKIEGVTVVGETAMIQLVERLDQRRVRYPGVTRSLDSEGISRVAAGDAFDLVLRQVPDLLDCKTASYPGIVTDYLCRQPRGIMLSGGAGGEEFLVCIDGVAS